MPLTKSDYDLAAATWGKAAQARMDAEITAQAALDALEKMQAIEAAAKQALDDTLKALPPGTL